MRKKLIYLSLLLIPIGYLVYRFVYSLDYFIYYTKYLKRELTVPQEWLALRFYKENGINTLFSFLAIVCLLIIFVVILIDVIKGFKNEHVRFKNK